MFTNRAHDYKKALISLVKKSNVAGRQGDCYILPILEGFRGSRLVLHVTAKGIYIPSFCT